MHGELKKAIVTIQSAAKDNQKSSGIYSTSGEQVSRDWVDFPLLQMYQGVVKLIHKGGFFVMYSQSQNQLQKSNADIKSFV